MTTYVNLQFINNEILSLSTSSFLFKQSKLLQSIDIDEDNTIPILCSHFYVLDENDRCLFDNKTDLSFMFTLLPNKFIEVCKFLDTICYENVDTSFSVHFIMFVMNNLKEEINVIKYFMQNEIKCIIQYNDNKHLVKYCIPAFYVLYLTEYKEEVIKYNRIDIYELLQDKTEYYRYIHKYDNHLTYIVKEIYEYNNYVINISKQLLHKCERSKGIRGGLNKIKELIEQGANIHFKDCIGCTSLHIASSIYNNLEVVKYLVEQGADVNLQNNEGYIALHYASNIPNNLEVIKYLVEQGANSGGAIDGCNLSLNLQNKYGCTALYYATSRYNNEEVINYLTQFN